jgi:transposase InsO family protein
MEAFYRRVGITRQAHEQWQRRDLKRLSMTADLIKEVKQYRSSVDFRAGSRVLFYNLDIKERYDIGVTKYEQTLSKEGLSLPVVRVRVITTTSSKQSWNYRNLICGLNVSGINQVIVGDITYIRHRGSRYYLFSLKDIYSGRIVGWCLSTDMKTEHALEALKMVVDCRGERNMKNTIHHTDGGGQYFSGLFLKEALEKGIRMSRAKTCLENGYAEQLNAYIKHHLMPLVKSKNLNGMKKELSRLIHQYNYDRKQEELGWLSPVEFEQELKAGIIKETLVLHDFSKT